MLVKFDIEIYLNIFRYESILTRQCVRDIYRARKSVTI